MKIRAYTPADMPDLQRLIRHIWGDDLQASRYYRFGPDSAPDDSRFFRTLVAESSGEPAGFAAAWTNPFHAHALYVSVHVHPAWRGQGYGTLLLKELSALNERHLPLQACTWETSVAGTRFLVWHGFEVVRRT